MILYLRVVPGSFLPPDSPRYEAVWQEMCDILREYTPLVEPAEMGQAVCDLTGCERLWGDSWTAARSIAATVGERTGILPWLGLASNRIVAQLASTTVGADGITVVAEGQERRFLADLPVGLLPDLDPRTALAFSVLGIRTMGQLAGLPPAAVAARFGAEGKRLHAYARGIDDRPVVPPPLRPSVSARYECEDGSLEEAVEALHRLAEECATELQERDLAGRLVELRVIWRDMERLTPESRSQPVLPQPSSEKVAVEHPALPVSYRIHSMIPQPGTGVTRKEEKLLPPQPGSSPRPLYTGRERAAVRLAITAAPPLLEHARRLLLQSWPKEDRKRRLVTLELKVAEFEEPVQLVLEGLGGLGGLSPDRRQRIAQQESVLLARYGSEPFRHVTGVDPAGILAERRFRWAQGLPGAVRRQAARRRRA